MATAYGVTDQGFVRKRLADIKAEVEADLRLTFGNIINLLPTSVFGQLVGVMSDREAVVWEALEDAYNSAYPATASGVSLDNVMSITGLTRLGATKSRVPIGSQLLFGTVGTVVPAGTLFSVLGNPSAQFQTLSGVTLVAGADEVQQLAFSSVPASGSFRFIYKSQTTDAIPYNASAMAIQTALRALTGLADILVTGSYAAGFVVTFTATAGKQDQPTLVATTTALVNASSTVVLITVSTTTTGSAQGTVAVEATSTGPTAAVTGSLSNIDTPVAGLARTVNLVDATLGRNTETDAEARLRRSNSTQIAGSGTKAAIKSRVLALANVTNVLVFDNPTNIVDLSGRPPKSYEVVVNGGADQDIASTVFSSKAIGMQPVGNQSTQVVDDEGTTQTVKWSRPTAVPIYASFDITTNSKFPATGLALVRQAVLDYGNALGLGGSVIVYPQLIAALSQIPGITNIVVRIDRAAVSTTVGATAVNANIVLATSEITTWDSSRVSVNVL